MNNSQEIANVIKKTTKSQNISVRKMLSDLGLGVNLIGQLSKGQAITYVNLAKIADYLGVSVDYLLGREANIKKEPDTSGELSVKNVKFIGRDGVVKYKKLTPEMISMLEQLPDSHEDL